MVPLGTHRRLFPSPPRCQREPSSPSAYQGRRMRSAPPVCGVSVDRPFTMGPNVLSVAVELHTTSYHSFGRNDGTSPQRAGVVDAVVSSAVYGHVLPEVDVPLRVTTATVGAACMRLRKSGASCSLPGLYFMSMLKLAIKAHQRARRPSHVPSEVVEFNVVRLRWSVSATTSECPAPGHTAPCRAHYTSAVARPALLSRTR